MCSRTDYPPYDDAMAYIASAAAPAAPMTHFCLCGARAYPNEAAQREAEPSRSRIEHHADGTRTVTTFLCPTCGTFAKDHACRCDEYSDFRCYDCDTRHGSHGGPR